MTKRAVGNIKKKRIFSAALVLLMVLSFCVPALAETGEGEPQPPVFTLELVEDGDAPGLYGTLSCIPAGVVTIQPVYHDEDAVSFYYPIEDENRDERIWVPTWLDGGYDGGPIEQLCAGLEDEPVCDYLDGTLNRALFSLMLTTEEGERYYVEPALITRNPSTQPPEEPPAITAAIEDTGQGLGLTVTLEDVPPDVFFLRAMFAYTPEGEFRYLDPGAFAEWNAGLEPPARKFRCARDTDEPLESYLAGTLERFYVRLELVLESGERYSTQTAEIARGPAQPPPEGSKFYAIYPASMRVRDGRFGPEYGKVCVTARAGMTTDDLKALLPAELPVEVQIVLPDGGVAMGMLPCAMDWTLPEGMPLADGQVLQSAAALPTLAAGTELAMDIGNYLLNRALTVEMSLRLSVTVISETAEADIHLDNTDAELGGAYPLTAAFTQKPSGATAIRYFYYYEGREDWVEVGELLEQAPVDVMPKDPASNKYRLFGEDESPFREYLAGEIDGFLVGMEIEGGIFDGELHTLKWPGEYTPPPKMPSFNGSGGNNGNAGSDNSGGDSNQGGQRPDLPKPKPTPTPEPLPTPTVEAPPSPTPVAPPPPEEKASPEPIVPPPLLEHPPEETAVIAPVQSTRPRPSAVVPESTPTPPPEPVPSPELPPSAEVETLPTPTPPPSPSKAASQPTPPPPREMAEESLPAAAIAAGVAVLAGGVATVLHFKKKGR